MGLLNAMYVKKCFPFPVYLEDISHLMLERSSPMDVNSAINGLVPTPHFRITEEVTLGKSPTPINSVGKLSVVPVTFERMNGLIVGRNPIHASSVVSASVLPALCKHTKGFMLEKSPINVNKVLEHSVAPLPLGDTNRLIVGRMPMNTVWESLRFQLELITNCLEVIHNSLMNVNSGKSLVSLTKIFVFV